MTTITDDGDDFTGGSGADSILVLANDVTARGANGNDLLTTSLVAGTSEYLAISTALYGGQGDDYLHAILGLQWDGDDLDGTGISVTLDGGTGNDLLWLEMRSDVIGESASLSGGDGDDTIIVTTQPFAPEIGGQHTAIDIDGGDGADTIIISVATLAEASGDDPGAYVSVSAGAGDDVVDSTISEGEANATAVLDGGDGADEISAVTSAGYMNGGIALNQVSGGADADLIDLEAHSVINEATNQAYGGEGEDTITALARAGSSEEFGTARNDLHGGAGNDRITAKAVLFDGGEVVNTVYGDGGDDRISASIQGDRDGDPAHSELYGGAGNDRLSVRGGEGNILNGGAGDDTLIGGSSSDTLIGLQGDDALQGKGGADIFLFGNIRSGERDRISDFVIGEDVIDLSQIDANRDRAGEQSFRFGTREGTGRAWIEEDPDTTGSILYADDGHRLLEVLLKDGRGVSAEDYSAGDFLL